MQPESILPLLGAPRSCVACGAPVVRALHVFRVGQGKARVTPQLNLGLVGCERCGLVFSVPTPTDEQLDAYYGSEGAGWDGRIGVDPARLAARLERKRANNARDYALLRANITLPGATRSALDFGCGIGAWLDVLAADGWETAGIEPGARAAALAGARHRVLLEIPEQPQFDLVVLQHVLEHLPDPLDVLRRLARATRAGGLLYASVPNFSRLSEHGAFNYIASDKHISSFTPDALASLFALAGFELVSHSNADAWVESEPRPARVRRLAAVARRVDGRPELPVAPLDAAVAALRAYAALQPGPLTAARESLPRRLVRRLLA